MWECSRKSTTTFWKVRTFLKALYQHVQRTEIAAFEVANDVKVFRNKVYVVPFHNTNYLKIWRQNLHLWYIQPTLITLLFSCYLLLLSQMYQVLLIMALKSPDRGPKQGSQRLAFITCNKTDLISCMFCSLRMTQVARNSTIWAPTLHLCL